MTRIGRRSDVLGVGLVLAAAVGATPAQADMDASCLEPLPVIQEELSDADEVTRRKVSALVEDAKLLCEEDKAALAQEKFARALQLAVGAERGPIER